MEIFGSLNLTWFDGIIVALICAIDEWIVKKLICKGDEKYKALYTYFPIVMAVIAYVVISLVQHTPWYAGLIKGLGIGLGAMGSYDAIITIIKTEGIGGVNKIGEDVATEVEKKNG